MATHDSVLQRSGLPPQLVLYQMAVGHYVSRALHVVVKLGIPDLLADGPRHYDDLAQGTATHAPALNRVLRLLASVGVFEEQENGRFALTPLGEQLRPGVPGSMRASVLLFAGPRVQDAWKDLEYCVQIGEPAYRRRGVTDPFHDPERDAEETANFDAAMAEFTRLAARCQAIGGDFFTEVPPGGDAYLLKHVIHDWDDDRAVRILQNCHRAMGAAGKLLLIEGVYPPRIEPSLEHWGAAANDVNMLVCTGGRQRSEAEFHALFAAAGFRLTQIIPTPARVSVIEGVRA